jgi:glycosyltransferase involved in cell wall biosynthesis
MDGVLSRGLSLNKIPKLIESFLLDLLSFHSADIILVESSAQLQRTHQLFAVPKKRIKVSYTGVNEKAFLLPSTGIYVAPKIKEVLSQTPEKITVLFRGRINKESGIENILAAAKILEEEAKFILVTGANKKLKNISANCFIYSNVTESEISEIYKKSDVALGQVSRHRRLRYTIPHKAFEAGYFGKTYITPKSGGVLELFSEADVYFIGDPSIENIVTAIRNLKDSSLRKFYETQVKETYGKFASQEVLNLKFEKMVLEI